MPTWDAATIYALNRTTAAPTDSRPRIKNELILAGLLSCILFFSLVQTLRICLFRHNLRSFQLTFVVLCLLWTGLRVFFWINTLRLQFYAQLFLYRVPTVLEFATFSLLIIFFTAQVHRDAWARTSCWARVPISRWIWCTYFIACAGLTTLMIVWGVSECNPKHRTCDTKQVRYEESRQQLFSASVFATLVVGFSYYMVKMILISSEATSNATHTAKAEHTRPIVPGPSPTSMGLLMLVLTIVYTSRAVYDFVTFFLPPIEIHGDDGGDKNLSLVALTLFSIWEVVPTAAVLFFFRSIPRTALRCACSPKCFATEAKPSPDETFPPKHPLLLDQQRLAYTDVFTNMDRYDLGEEVLQISNLDLPCSPTRAASVSGFVRHPSWTERTFYTEQGLTRSSSANAVSGLGHSGGSASLGMQQLSPNMCVTPDTFAPVVKQTLPTYDTFLAPVEQESWH